MNAYLDALRHIPSGETRSFMELAAMAGRPGAARAAGRAIAACRTSESHLPWHRVVSSTGRGRDPAQLRRLRREGSRPRARESIVVWARRIGAGFIGSYPTREFASRDGAPIAGWSAEEVEPFFDDVAPLARGFAPVGSSGRGEVPLPDQRDVVQRPKLAEIRARCDAVDWDFVRDQLRRDGISTLPALLSPGECTHILNQSTEIERFERTIVMLPKGYGVGTYHYYQEPLPEPARALRDRLYQVLAPDGYPGTLAEFWTRCREAGQRRASSILIGYGKGGVNHPHRDVYGPVAFPFQALVALSRRGRDFAGGSFYVADDDGSNRVREVAVNEGDVVVFATRERLSRGRKVPLRHGMTTVTRGTRYGLGLVFHLAE